MIKKFIASLKKSPNRPDVFNPWWDVDARNDINKQCPLVRRKQLSQYLSERVGKAKHLLVGEALGYQGGHFTGIAMTSERMLLGGHEKKGILPEHAFSGIKAKRTSKPGIRPHGFTEPTGTIVWGHMIDAGLDPRDFILWNAYPWHPFKPAIGPLSNRTPSPKELPEGRQILMDLIGFSKPKIVMAVGEKAFALLTAMGIKSVKVRHPANGGASKFRAQFTQAVGP
jgi:uracil-DNA glycosylase